MKNDWYKNVLEIWGREGVFRAGDYTEESDYHLLFQTLSWETYVLFYLIL